MNNTLERRKHKRAQYGIPLQVQPVSPSKSGNVFEVQDRYLGAGGVNISEGGLNFELGESLQPGSILKVTFKIRPQDSVEHETYAKVMWVKKTNHGVQFLMLEENTLRKIRGFIETGEPAN